jgi:hypothetical protein
MPHGPGIGRHHPGLQLRPGKRTGDRSNGRVTEARAAGRRPVRGRRPAASRDGGPYGWVVVPVVVCGACCWAAGAVAVVGWVFGPFLQSAVVKPLRQLVSAFQRLR